MLLVDVRELHDGDVLAIQGQIDMPQIAAENMQVLGITPIDVDLVAARDERICRVQGQLRATLRYQCSRCLDEFDDTLQMPFHELFSERETREDVNVVDGPQIELDPYIEEAVNLAIDYRPLCRVDCRGLCPTCGTNLNDEQCGCERTIIDPRWAVLGDLLLKDEPE